MKSLPTSYAVLIGALLISIAILATGGVNLKSISKLLGMANCDAPETAEEVTKCNKPKLLALATKVELDLAKFRSCLDSGKFKQEVLKDQQDAEGAGLSGTPGFIVGKSNSEGVISGIRISGAYPYDTFRGIIEKLLTDASLEEILVDQKDLEAGAASVDDDAIIGDKNAPITLIEFSDYECPFCKRHFSQTYPVLKKEYIDSGKVKLVLRDFIAVNGTFPKGHNPTAQIEAEAANCAKEQKGDEGYIKFHDLLYQNTRSNGLGLQ